VDVVHAHGLRAGALTVLALEREHGVARPRIVVTAHNALPAGPLGGGAAGLVYRALERVVAHGADLVLCVSPDLESRMRSAGARHVAQAVIAAPAPAEPSPAGKRLPRGTGPGRPVVLAAGRLAPQKGFDVLLSAAARWRDLDPPPLVLIAGEGPLAKKLRAQAVELDVPAVFLGHHDDVPALLASAAVFVLPSRWEGQPLVLQEALRAGAPIVATKAGGIPALAGEDTVLLVPPDDVDALDDAVRSVLTDPALSFALTAAARTRAATLPTEKDAVEAALTAYTRIPG
jgi:glycosyltransferase involved in cell wall biosynthesis